ncbi:MAG: HutD family protein, partial [Ilumatobacteraceae bacterium]
ISREPRPWRNGLGVQYEVTADGPLPDGWTWRLSTADLNQDVPFSIYEGVTREFCVAIGGGVFLTIDGVEHRCGPHSITTFDGGLTVQASIIDGPTKDINLMVKHGSPQMHMSIHNAGESLQGVEALVALSGGATLIVDDTTIMLDELDAILSARESTVVVTSGSIVTVRRD